MTRILTAGLGLVAAAVGGIATSRAIGSRPDDPAAHGPLAPCGDEPNCTHAQVRLGADPEAVREAARAVVREDAHWLTGRARRLTLTDDGVRAVFRTGLFDDDLAVSVQPAGDGSLLTVRSAARVGRSDLGVNRMRVNRLVEAVRARLGT